MGKLSMDLYLDNVIKKYRKANRREKSAILEELCAISGYHKKHAIRLLNQRKPHKNEKKSKRGRTERYSMELYLEPLKHIWLATDQLCGKRLEKAMPLWLPYYSSAYGALAPELYEGLLEMSASTIDRMLSKAGVKIKRGLSGTKPGTLLKKHIPIKTDQWDEEKPGFLEADTVAHCGSSLAGDFAWSLTMTDICSGWTENRAVWNKGSIGVLAQIEDIEKSLPFDILGFDSDNGSEFLNWHLIRYFTDEERPRYIQLSRSRPYHSDDNAHVEQKNWTHVRQLFGYERFNKKDVVELMNDLYRNEVSLMNNYFLPNTKLIEKRRVEAKIIKKYDKPCTPYQRLMKSEYISEAKKEKLQKTYNVLNPFELRTIIKKKVDRIFRLINNKYDKNMCYK